MTLNAVIALILSFLMEFDRFSNRLYHSWWRRTYNVRKILSPSSSLLLFVKTITHPAARSHCDSWASCCVSIHLGRWESISIPTRFHQLRRDISILGWDKTTSVFEKWMAAILEFYIRFWFWSMCVIIHLLAKFHSNRMIGSRVTSSFQDGSHRV